MGHNYCTLQSMKFKALFLLIFPVFSFAQLQFEKTSHDFGDIKADEERFVDIQVKNTGKKREYFLSFRKTTNVTCLSNGQYIEPDSTLFIRLQPNPPGKGKFSYQVEIYTSDRAEATLIQVKGNLTELPSSMALQSCPDFNSRPPKAKLSPQMQLKVVDKLTREPVPSVTYVVQNGMEILRVNTKKSAEKVKIPIGFTLFFVKSDGYVALDTALFIGPNRDLVELELIKTPQPVIASTEPVKKDTVALSENRNPKQEEISESQPPRLTTGKEDKPLKEELQQISQETSVAAPIKLDSLPPTDFSSEHFMPLNVVFVMDVSSSMQASEKMNLAKYALNQLVDILRPEDKMGLVTFATNSELIFSADEKLSKEQVHNKISGLKADGSTAGVAGLKKGLQELEKQYLAQGRNILIVITDGGFEMNAAGEKLLQRAREKQIVMSVIGVKSGPTDAQNLTTIATNGHGTFIPINKLAQAQQNLIREIRISCFKGI